jgi:hypothetical protein
MKRIGTFRGKRSADIAGSKIGVGFECLDRGMWDDTDEAYRLVGATGAKHARVQTGWNRCEQSKGSLDFAWLDRTVDKLLEQGIQPWFNVGYGNIHHTDAEEPDAVGWAPIRSDASRAAWTNFVTRLVQHFRGRVTHYEVWNEPDIDAFWVGGSDVDEYMELLQLTVPLIRRQDPDARVIGGAMAAGFSCRGFAVLEEYLKRGMAGLIDVFSYHRYRVVPELYSRADLAHLRAAFAAHGNEGIEFWQAESGCPSQSAPTQALANTPFDRETQARLLCRSLLTDLGMGVDYTCWFHFSDFRFYYRNGFCDVPNHFGLVTFDDPPQPKPAYYAFQRICALFDADTVRSPRMKVDMGLANMNASPERYAFQVEMTHARVATFERCGVPLISLYQPADLFPSVAGNTPYEARDVELYIWTPGRPIVNPVVLDPISGSVFAPQYDTNGMGRTDVTPQIVLHGVPLKDYPLFVTDRDAVADLIEW